MEMDEITENVRKDKMVKESMPIMKPLAACRVNRNKTMLGFDNGFLLMLYVEAHACNASEDRCDRWREISLSMSDGSVNNIGTHIEFIKCPVYDEEVTEGGVVRLVARGEVGGELGYLSLKQGRDVIDFAESVDMEIEELNVLILDHDAVGTPDIPLIVMM